MERVDAMRCLCDERMASGSSRLTALAFADVPAGSGGLLAPRSPTPPSPAATVATAKGKSGVAR